jgi:hypothetical protein
MNNTLIITPNEERILEYLLEKGEWVSPTEIGKMVGGGKWHSAWASPICLRLVRRGLLMLDKKGHCKALDMKDKFGGTIKLVLD